MCLLVLFKLESVWRFINLCRVELYAPNSTVATQCKIMPVVP